MARIKSHRKQIGECLMKKLLVLLLTVAMLLSCLALLSSCFAHKCEFSTDWEKNDTEHWHACTKEGCVEVSDKAEHSWDAGIITTKATQEADGVKTYTCTACSHIKTEGISFTGMTADEWNGVFSLDNFKNFTMDMKIDVTATNTDMQMNMNMEGSMLIKLTEGGGYFYSSIAGEEQEETAQGDGTELAKEVIDMFDYDKFTYDAQSKTYRAKEKIAVTWLDDELVDNAAIRFENGRLVEMTYTYFEQEVSSGITIDMKMDFTVSFVDYGTTVI